MPYEAELDLSKFPPERYISDDRVRISYIEAIFRRFRVPEITLVGKPQTDWIYRSYSHNYGQLIARFFERNPKFGPQTNLAQLLQILSCQVFLKYSTLRSSTEYKVGRQIAESKFAKLSSYLSIVTFRDDADMRSKQLKDTIFPNLDIHISKRPKISTIERNRNIDTLVENISQQYPGSTGPFRQN